MGEEGMGKDIPSLHILCNRLRGMDMLTSLAFGECQNNFFSTKLSKPGVLDISMNTFQGSWCRLICSESKGLFYGEDSEIAAGDLIANEGVARAAFKKLGSSWRDLSPRRVRRSTGWTFAFTTSSSSSGWSSLQLQATSRKVAASWWMRPFADSSFNAIEYCRSELGVNDIAEADNIARFFPVSRDRIREYVGPSRVALFEKVAKRVGYPVISG